MKGDVIDETFLIGLLAAFRQLQPKSGQWGRDLLQISSIFEQLQVGTRCHACRLFRAAPSLLCGAGADEAKAPVARGKLPW